MNKLFLMAAIFLIIGCSTMQYTPNPVDAGPSGGVSVLYEYPNTKYKSLGVIEYEFYQPGFGPPAVEDAIPDLKKKALEIGGNALIVRDHQQTSEALAFITITAEVLLVHDDPKPQDKSQDRKVLMHIE